MRGKGVDPWFRRMRHLAGTTHTRLNPVSARNRIGATNPCSMWPGKIYQFPLYETLFAVVYALSFVWLRDCRDADGFSPVERGADDLGLVSPVR